MGLFLINEKAFPFIATMLLVPHALLVCSVPGALGVPSSVCPYTTEVARWPSPMRLDDDGAVILVGHSGGAVIICKGVGALPSSAVGRSDSLR